MGVNRSAGRVKGGSAAAGGLRAHGAQQDVDGVAVASAGLMPAQPREVVRVAASDLAQGPALVAAEVQAQLASIGAEGAARCAMGGGFGGRGRGSASAVVLPPLTLHGIADQRIGPIQVGHAAFGHLIQRRGGIGMKLAGQDAVGGTDHVRIGIRMDVEDAVGIPALDHRSGERALDDLAQDGQRQRALAQDHVVEATNVEPITLA